MRITNQRSLFAKAALCSAISFALFGCGGDSVKSDPPLTDGGDNGGEVVTPTVSVAPDYILNLGGQHLPFGGTMTESNVANPDVVSSVALRSVKPLGSVVKTTKPASAETWAGSTLPDTKVLDFSDERGLVTMWVYAPAADLPVMLKVENASDGAQFIEIQVNTTKANEWEMLTFDLAGKFDPEAVYDKKSLFFDFGNQGTERVFYWDDVRHEGFGLSSQPQPESYPMSDTGKPLLGNPEYQAISYGAWRTDIRDQGEIVPSVAEQKEDMKILSAMGIKMIRTYNTQGFKGLDGESNTENLLEAIRQLKAEDENFEMYVMLGVWIDALNAWTGAPIDSSKDSPANALEMAKAKELALKYPDIVKVIAVGNEAMVDWAASYKVHPSIILSHVNDLQSWKLENEAIKDLWVTTSDNWAVWAGLDANGNQNEQADLKALINAIDYVSLHTYAFHDAMHSPAFKERWKVPSEVQSLSKEEQINYSMDAAYQYTVEQIALAQQFVSQVDPTKPIHIGETGWSTVSTEGHGEGGTQAADEFKQKRFYDDMRDFSNDIGASLFFFQAFDEPWKGDPANSSHSEKHFGLVDIDCNVKYAAWEYVDTLNDANLSRDCAFVKSHGGSVEGVLDAAYYPPQEIAVPDEPDLVDGEFRVLGFDAYEGAGAIAWESTAGAQIFFDVDNAHGVFQIDVWPTGAKDWGWGTHIGATNSMNNFTSMVTLRFDVRGDTSEGAPLAQFPFNVGIQTDKGEQWASNHTVTFNNGTGFTLTEEWQTVEIKVSQLGGEPALDKVVAPFMVHGTTNQGLTESKIQFRNISWFNK